MMELKDMTIDELMKRRSAIGTEVDSDGADLDALENEVRSINAELEARKDAETKKAEVRSAVAEGLGEIKETIPTEERKTMTDKEIRSSQEYINAYVDYIKGKSDGSECRQMLTENGGGTVPVPTYIADRIQTAWENDEIMSRVKRTFLKGNLKQGVEMTASPAEFHTEGESVDEEGLALAIVEIIPQTCKKWISVSTEVLDMDGQAFLDYLYDEIVYQIVKATARQVLMTIDAAPTTIDPTNLAPIRGEKSVSALALDDIISAIGQLTGDARNPVFIANRATIAAYQGLALGANYAADIFGGATVIATDILPSFASASANAPFAYVGDLGAIMANYPNGDDVKFVFDEYTLADKDLVRIVGRQMVGIGYVRNMAFVEMKKGS